MTGQPAGHPTGHAPRRYTSAALSGGALLAAACFVVAVAAETIGSQPGTGSMTDIGAVIAGLSAFTPWAWATLGVYVVMVAPLLGLVVTAWEYSRVGDRRSVGLAIAVIAVLVASAAIAILR